MDIANGVLAVLAHGVEGIVGGVGMAGDEVDRQLVLRAVVEEFLYPHALPLLLVDFLLRIEHRLLVVSALAAVALVGNEVARGRTAHAQLWVDALHGLRRHLIEVEVLALRTVEESEVEVRLVPHLKIPLAHLVQAVAVDDVLAESLHEGTPLRHLRLVVGHAVAIPHLQFAAVLGDALGEERQFDEGAYAEVEHTVVDLVDVLPIVYHAAVGLLEVDAHVVVEQAVHS